MRARLSFVLPLCASLITTVCAVPLPTVTNISLSCHNLKNVLSWKYNEPDHPEFIINIQNYGNGLTTVRTNATFLDITEYTQGAENSFYVTVEAEGSEQNASSQGISFSYNEDAPTDITCVVDFPALEVSVLPHKVILSFRHPSNVHEDESFNDDFQYTISYNGTEKTCTCMVEEEEEEECTEELHLYESLNGRCINLLIKGTINSIPMEISRKVCGDKAVYTDWVLLLTILICCLVGFLLLMLLVFLVYKKLTQPDSEITIFTKLLRIVNSDHIVNEPEEPTMSKVTTLIQAAPLDFTDEPSSDPSFTPLEEKPLVTSYPPTHISTHFNDDVNLTEEQDQGEMTDDADSVGFGSGNSFSGYDSCKFPIDMGQGDIVDAYGPRNLR
ncbi:interferon gamma receptor 1-like precursor [Silurus meridionalis]|nr:interferon gamma receptor 1-like precursor [Silurus meridionalis]